MNMVQIQLYVNISHYIYNLQSTIYRSSEVRYGGRNRGGGGLGGSNRRFMVEEKIMRGLREGMWGIDGCT